MDDVIGNFDSVTCFLFHFNWFRKMIKNMKGTLQRNYCSYLFSGFIRGRQMYFFLSITVLVLRQLTFLIKLRTYFYNCGEDVTDKLFRIRQLNFFFRSGGLEKYICLPLNFQNNPKISNWVSI